MLKRRVPERLAQEIASVDVSRETYQVLTDFADLVVKWNPKINLIARSTVSDIWDRHVFDSVQLYQLVPDHYDTWVDLGSGGGFPGIIMAIIAKEKQPKAEFTLIESDQRKATFLRTAIRQLSLNATVICQRIEDAPRQNACVVSARALAALPALLGYVHRHLASDGSALLHKGKSAATEMAEARQTWSFSLEERSSLTDPAARLLTIKGLQPRV